MTNVCEWAARRNNIQQKRTITTIITQFISAAPKLILPNPHAAAHVAVKVASFSF
jgi:hypothetical protein